MQPSQQNVAPCKVGIWHERFENSGSVLDRHPIIIDYLSITIDSSMETHHANTTYFARKYGWGDSNQKRSRPEGEAPGGGVGGEVPHEPGSLGGRSQTNTTLVACVSDDIEIFFFVVTFSIFLEYSYICVYIYFQ